MPLKSMVSISDPQQQYAHGAGWLLRDGRVVTCAHVVENSEKKYHLGKSPFIEQESLLYKVTHILPLREAKGGALMDDLALLKPVDEDNRIKPDGRYFWGDIQIGKKVESYGFPERQRNGTSGHGAIGQAYGAERYEVTEADRVTEKMTQGFSGSPILQDGRIIGIFAATHEAAGRGYLITLDKIEAWLKEIGEVAAFPFGRPSFDRIEDLRQRLWGRKTVGASYGLRLRDSKSDPSGYAIYKQELAPTYQEGDWSVSHLFDFIASRRKKVVLLKGPGGYGKTSILLELANELILEGTNFVWLNLKELKSDLAKKSEEYKPILERLDSSIQVLMKAIAECCGIGPTSEFDRDTGQQIVIIADGVNEVGQHGQALLHALEKFVDQRTQYSLVLSQRTSTKATPKTSHQSLFILPLPVSEIKIALDDQYDRLSLNLKQTLSRPQLLDIFENRIAQSNVASENDLFREYFLSILDFPNDKGEKQKHKPGEILKALEISAFRMFREDAAALKILSTRWDRLLSEALNDSRLNIDQNAVSQQLIDQGVMIKSTEGGGQQEYIEFQHSLYAEWLAANRLIALGESSWTNSAFTALSIEDSSEDGLRLALDLLDKDSKQVFLLKMYDWRWQRVLSLVTDQKIEVDKDFSDAVIGLNALRLHDDFSHTQSSFRDLVMMREGPENSFLQKLLASKSEGEVIELLRERFASDLSGDLKPWRNLFFGPEQGAGQAAGRGVAQYLFSTNPFLGWSACNIFRVIGFDNDVVAAIRAGYHASYATAITLSAHDLAKEFAPTEAGVGVRWRLVHTLGRGAEEDSLPDVIKLLLEIWKNGKEHVDVRFGASRSLLEIALNAPEHRDAIFRSFIEALTDWRDKCADGNKDYMVKYKVVEEFWRASKPASGNGDDLVQWRKGLQGALTLIAELDRSFEWGKQAEIELAIQSLGEE